MPEKKRNIKQGRRHYNNNKLNKLRRKCVGNIYGVFQKFH